MPNTGKSTLYNRLTGGNAQIANWPGLTVELLRGAMPPDRSGHAYQLVDLPGIHDLSGSSEDEAVVQRFLRHTPPDLLLLVLNASQITSQLRLLLQLRALGLPMVVALNMSDEARRFGITIDTGGLGEALGLPVLAVSARRNQGIHLLIDRVHQLGEELGRQGHARAHHEPDLAQALAEIPQERVDALLAQHVQLPPRLHNPAPAGQIGCCCTPWWVCCCSSPSFWPCSNCSMPWARRPRTWWGLPSTGSRPRSWSQAWRQ